MDILVHGNRLEVGGKIYDCAIGKNGFTHEKAEGDLCSPIGEFALRGIYYRGDKIAHPETELPTQETKQNDGWCDAPDSPDYNRAVKIPHPESHEKMWRDDGLYDIVVVLGQNDSPPVAGKGSAIFLHIAKPNYEGTEGCVALEMSDMLEILGKLKAGSKISINAE